MKLCNKFERYRAVRGFSLATSHGRRQAWARGGTCPLLEMRKWVLVTVTKCTLEYLNRQ